MTRLPIESCEPPSDAAAAPATPETRRAFGLVDAAMASSIIFLGSLMARFTPDSITGRPAKRSRSLTPTSVAKTAATASLMTDAGSNSTPPEPWVSMRTS